MTVLNQAQEKDKLEVKFFFFWGGGGGFPANKKQKKTFN